jgi:hypothetical protein
MERRRPRKRALPDLTGGYRLPGFVSLTLGRGKFPISVWLGAKGTRVQFTRPSIAAPQVVPGTDNIRFLGFHALHNTTFRSWKMLDIAHFQDIRRWANLVQSPEG